MNISEYQRHLEAAGCKVLCGEENTVWVTHERFSMLRVPACALSPPTRDEIKRIFRHSRAAILSYAVDPSTDRPANAVLYICADPHYSLERLSKNARYDVRRGLKEFDIQFLEQSEVLQLGKQAYSDTLLRTGLSAEHRGNFEDLFGQPRMDRRFLGAIRGRRLAAFLTLVNVDNWVSVGGYSADEFLPLFPNNALVFHAVHHYLVEKKATTVDYGLSSVQAVSNAQGLDHFKRKMGFQALPVHRVFVVNPLLRPFVSPLSSLFLSRMLRLYPRHPLIKKAEGALRLVRQKQ